MFFVLSKTVAFLLLPSNFLVLLGLAGLALWRTRWRRLGKHLAGLGIGLLLMLACLPVGAVLTHVLESRFPPWDPARGAPDGIVVLGGAISPALSRSRGAVQLSGSAERVTIIARLAREYPAARIVYSGGDAGLLANAGREADYLFPLLDTFGVSRERVMLENRSRNTYENALFTRRLAGPARGERWLLITSARHMPRAVGCFRQVGLPVEAYPVDWQTGPQLQFRLPGSFGAGLASADQAVREWLGLFIYWVTGRTSALLPGPFPAR